jgi:short-subunit dehydrogenase
VTEFDGQTILVTGASRGIGRALVERLAAEPVRVLAGMRDTGDFKPAAAHEATEVKPVRIDLSSREDVEASVAELGDELDRIDILVNNAGAFTAGLLEQQDVGDIYNVMQATLVGPVHLTRLILPAMLARGSGKIVTNSSLVGYLHFPGVTTYSAAKSGVAGFAESLRRELAETDLTTLHVITGGIETDMLGTAMEDLQRHVSTSGWEQHTPEEWAGEIVSAIASDRHTLGPGGKAALGKLATHMPSFVLDTVASRAFSREPAEG